MTVKHLLEQKGRNLWTIDPDATGRDHATISSATIGDRASSLQIGHFIVAVIPWRT
jgi:hypothetical protein